MSSDSALFGSSTESLQMEDASMTSSQLNELIAAVGGEESIQQKSDDSTAAKLSLDSISVLSPSEFRRDVRSLEQIHVQQKEDASMASSKSSDQKMTQQEMLMSESLLSMSVSKVSSSRESKNLVELMSIAIGTISISVGSHLESINETNVFPPSDGKKSNDTMDEVSLPELSSISVHPAVANQTVWLTVGEDDCRKEVTILHVLEIMETTIMIQFLDFSNSFLNDGDVRPIEIVLEQASKTSTVIHKIVHRGSNDSYEPDQFMRYVHSDNGAKILANALSLNPPLRRLDLSSNKIGDKGAMALAKALESNSTLRHFDLRWNLLGDKGAAAFGKALENNTTLSYLNLEGNLIGGEGARAISKALQTNSTLQDLNLESNSIGDSGATALAYALEMNSSLQRLHLSHSSICDKGAKAVAEAMRVNIALKELDMRGNSIGDEGAVALAKASTSSSTLKHIQLCLNAIGAEGATAFANVLEINSSLQYLELGLNDIGNEGGAALAKALEVNSVLQRLDLARNSIGEEGATALAKALETNTNLSSLDLGMNLISDEGATVFAKALETNATLRNLHIGSQISVDGAMAFLKALRLHNGTLIICCVSGSGISETIKNEIDVLVDQNEDGTRSPRPTPCMPPASRAKFSPSKKDRLYVRKCDLNEKDVIGGTDSTGSLHSGNRLYREDIDRVKQDHIDKNGKHGPFRDDIIENLINRGGRFVSKDKQGRYYLQTRKEAKDKVAQALKPRKSRAKKRGLLGMHGILAT